MGFTTIIVLGSIAILLTFFLGVGIGWLLRSNNIDVRILRRLRTDVEKYYTYFHETVDVDTCIQDVYYIIDKNIEYTKYNDTTNRVDTDVLSYISHEDI